MYEHERASAIGWADRAAEIAMGLFHGDGLEVRRKADMTLVTQADTSVERMLREQIAAAFPDDAILGEEEGGSHDPSGRVWILDPIDGTANFARGVQVWATLIALQIDGVGVLGVVNAPALGERYVAVRGEGATLNAGSIHVTYSAATQALIADCWRPRGFGDFWAHMLVARGSAEVMLEPRLATWDLAAPQVVLEEAGGRCTTFEGGPLGHERSMLATNGLVHDEVLARLTAR